MKIAIVSSHANGDIEPSVSAHLLAHLPHQVSSPNAADVTVVPVSWQHNFKFNEKLHQLENKKYALLDFAEFGWDAGEKNNIFGTGMTQQFSHLNTPDYTKLDQWVGQHPPVLTLKRELFQHDRSPTMLPVEWPCALPATPLQTKAEFDARPMEILFAWGLSNPMRPRLHGQIFANAHNHNINVIDDLRDDGRFSGRCWATVHIPHFRRVNLAEIMKWNYRAKISISLWGAGRKCFRSSMESPVGSIMALPDDPLSWSFDWTHGVNCIRLYPALLFEDLEAATHRNDLWDIYRASQDTVDRYRSTRYVNEYILPALQSVL